MGIRERRKRRLTRRIAHIEDRLETIDSVREGGGFEARLGKWAAKVLSEADIEEFDEDGDGKLDFEELVDVAVERADELIDLGAPLEAITDAGLEILAEVAVIIHENTERRLRRRLGRLRRRLQRIEGRDG